MDLALPAPRRPDEVLAKQNPPDDPQAHGYGQRGVRIATDAGRGEQRPAAFACTLVVLRG